MLEGGGGSVNYASALNPGSNCFVFNGLYDGAGNVAFPNVAALADATANPTDALFGSLNFLYNGTTWDRWRSVGTGVAKTDMSSIAATATATGNGTTNAGTQRMTLSSDSTGQVALAAGSASVGTVGLNAGTALVGKIGIDQTTPGTTNAVQAIPGTSGGTAVCYLAAAATTNSTNCKNSAGQIYLYHLENTTSTIYYLRMYNLTTAPTCSSATGYVESIPIPASTAAGGVVVPQDMGEAFATGIGFCVTGGAGSTDNTNAAVGVFIRILDK
jgi:hypothetical protein